MRDETGTKTEVVKKYEMIREIFNRCSGNQMRDVEIQEIETSNPEAWVADFFPGKLCIRAKSVHGKTLIFDLDADGLIQRFSFTPV